MFVIHYKSCMYLLITSILTMVNFNFRPCVLCEALLIQGYKEGNGWFPQNQL